MDSSKNPAAVCTMDTHGTPPDAGSAPSTQLSMQLPSDEPDYKIAAAMALILWPEKIKLGVWNISNKGEGEIVSDADLRPSSNFHAIALKLGLPFTKEALRRLLEAARELIHATEKTSKSDAEAKG